MTAQHRKPVVQESDPRLDETACNTCSDSRRLGCEVIRRMYGNSAASQIPAQRAARMSPDDRQNEAHFAQAQPALVDVDDVYPREYVSGPANTKGALYGQAILADMVQGEPCGDSCPRAPYWQTALEASQE